MGRGHPPAHFQGGILAGRPTQAPSLCYPLEPQGILESVVCAVTTWPPPVQLGFSSPRERGNAHWRSSLPCLPPILPPSPGSSQPLLPFSVSTQHWAQTSGKATQTRQRWDRQLGLSPVVAGSQPGVMSAGKVEIVIPVAFVKSLKLPETGPLDMKKRKSFLCCLCLALYCFPGGVRGQSIFSAGDRVEFPRCPVSL